MKSQSRRNTRIYSLDSLRAIMMLLGLVLHSAITYEVYENSAWSLKDSITHISNDYIVDFIHVFRMQIFFLIAGFFGSMLFYKRKPLKMIKNRAERIVFPFIVFLFLLWPTVVFAFGYSGLVFEGDRTLGRN
jgi:fucose 4-O-acetylase-like acetyltransferase